ncbi:hypothetical protein COT29_04010 [Candidatus Micrarchaeota archaeon CG08_land_8_20_14_0_20_59_11]|nr:MAG: hypothetical protein COT29_04010 [Candidatus Micrarchaeota archaeon CG08_land_8_20_14_0_20_59_11]
MFQAVFRKRFVEMAQSRDSRLVLALDVTGAQGGDAAKAAKAGTNFAIVGRSIIEAQNPAEEARRLRRAFNAVI